MSLTKATQERIIAYILNGGTPTVAAKAARVSLRTFREWMSRGEGRHPTRPSTPKLRAFAQAVNEAAAQTTLLALTRAYRDKPLDWLKMAGPSLGEPGEGDPQDAPGRSQDVGDPALAKFSDEELHIEIRGFDLDRAEKGAFTSPPCPDKGCSCGWHDNWEDETERLAPYEQARSRRRPVGG